MAEVAPLAAWSEEDLLEAVVKTPAPLLLALDGVQDPHNLGACLRTADACGVLALIVPRDRAAPLNATARKVAAGAAETTPVVTVTNLARTLGLLKGAGLWIVGADAAGSQQAHEIDLTGGRVLVMGAEGAGLRQLTRRHCDWLVRLPSLGAVESLNVSVATGMLLYEALTAAGVAGLRLRGAKRQRNHARLAQDRQGRNVASRTVDPEWPADARRRWASHDGFDPPLLQGAAFCILAPLFRLPGDPIAVSLPALLAALLLSKPRVGGITP